VRPLSGEARAIRYFECGELAAAVRELITKKQWRFARFANAKMIAWALKEA
jgi:hypothetical protein